MAATMMFDHPAWHVAKDGRAWRAFRSAGAVWSVVCTPGAEETGHTVEVARIAGESGSPPVHDIIDPAVLDTGSNEIGERLRAAGAAARVRNSNMWDALATSILRQVIRAAQARKLYRAFCRAFGEQVETSAGLTWLFPSPETVLALPDDEYTKLGMAFKRRPLCAAAEAYLKNGHEWVGLAPAQLVVEIQTVPRIGPWTAGATVADITNDYSLYPFADLAVRTWAKALSPSFAWPDDEPEFAAAWQALAGDQLSSWTLLTLAWGVRHAHGAAL